MLQFLLPALLGAAGSIGSVFLGNSMQQAENRRAERVAMEREDSKIQRVVDQSRAAGLSPLVGMGSPAAGAMASPVIDQSGSNVASAGAQIFGQLGAELAAMKTDADLEFQKAQTDNLRASTASMLMDARSRTVGSALRSADRGGAVPASTDVVTIPSPFGLPGIQAQHPRGAQAVQDAYGDIAEQVYGTSYWLDDFLRQLRRDDAERMAKRERERRFPGFGGR